MTTEERLTLLEKEVAELKAAVQPEQIAENLAFRLEDVCIKIIDQKQACDILKSF